MASVLEKVSRAISRNYGVKVEFKGSNAYTTGKTIVLPVLPDDIDKNDEMKIRGYCDHEICHLLYTNFHIWDNVVAKCGDGRIVNLTNLLEDFRCERSGKRDYPGAGINMEKTMKYLAQEDSDKDPSLMSKFWIQGRRFMCGYVFEDMPDYHQDIIGEFGYDVFADISDLPWDKAGTKAAFELAKKILEAYEKQAQAQKESQEQKQEQEQYDSSKNQSQAENDQEEGGQGSDPFSKSQKDREQSGQGQADQEQDGQNENGQNQNGQTENGQNDSGQTHEESGSTEGDQKNENYQNENGQNENGQNGNSQNGNSQNEREENGDAQDCQSGAGQSDHGEENQGQNGNGENSENGDGLGGYDETDLNAGRSDQEVKGNGDQGEEGQGRPGDHSEKSFVSSGDSHLEFDDFKDRLDELKKEIQKIHKDAVGSGKYLVYNTAFDEVIKVEEFIEKYRPRYRKYRSFEHSIDIYNELKSDLEELNVAKNKMGRMFNTRTASKWINDREKGKINPRALAKVKTGYKNVFRERYVSKDVDTAIIFLIDHSGSMNGKPLRNAMKTAIFFMETLKQTKIKYEVLGFTTGKDLCGNGDFWTMADTYGRLDAIITYVYKEFSEPFNRKIKERVSNFGKLRTDCNQDQDSIKVAYRRLLARRESRRILIVLSDGNIAGSSDSEKGIAELKRTIKQMEKSGIECIGIGVNTDVSHYYEKNVFLKDSSSIPKTMVTELKKILKV